MNNQHAEGLGAFDAGLIVLEQCAAEFPDSKEVRRAIQDYTKGRDNWLEHLKNASGAVESCLGTYTNRSQLTDL
jgi:hypothetical protein